MTWDGELSSRQLGQQAQAELWRARQAEIANQAQEEREFRRFFYEIEAAAWSCLVKRQEAAKAQDAKEVSAAEAHKTFEWDQATLVRAICTKFGGKPDFEYEPDLIRTDKVGSVRISRGRDWRWTVYPVSNTSARVREALEEFERAIPTGGQKFPGTPNGRTVAQIATETATKVGGTVVFMDEDLVHSVRVVTSASTIHFVDGIRPASERPWLRGGTVEVETIGVKGRKVMSLADVWNPPAPQPVWEEQGE